jgi:hypothetical protein
MLQQCNMRYIHFNSLNIWFMFDILCNKNDRCHGIEKLALTLVEKQHLRLIYYYSF